MSCEDCLLTMYSGRSKSFMELGSPVYRRDRPDNFTSPWRQESPGPYLGNESMARSRFMDKCRFIEAVRLAIHMKDQTLTQKSSSSGLRNANEIETIYHQLSSLPSRIVLSKNSLVPLCPWPSQLGSYWNNADPLALLPNSAASAGLPSFNGT